MSTNHSEKGGAKMGDSTDAYSKDLQPAEYFKLVDGHIIRNLHELHDFLTIMDDKVFHHHVTDKKNDFSNWIRYVFNDRKLATDLLKLKNKGPMANRIEKTIKQLEKQQAEEAKAQAKAAKEMEKQAVQEAKEEAEAERSKLTEAEDSLAEKLDEILIREKEIQKREEKIEEIEEKIEKDLHERKTKFFSKEFVQGIIIGILFTLIAILIYVKFVQEYFDITQYL